MALNFNDIRGKITGAGQATSQKAKDLTEVVKLNSTISECENKINTLYTNLGYEVYSKYHETPLPEMEEIFEQLNSLHATIDECKQQIQTINAANSCPNCGAKIKQGMIFCSNCGFKLPVHEQPAAAEAPIPQFCGNCGAPIPEGAMFCTSCGAKLN